MGARLRERGERDERAAPPQINGIQRKYEARERDERAERRRSCKCLHQKGEGEGGKARKADLYTETPRALKARARPTAAGRKLAGVRCSSSAHHMPVNRVILLGSENISNNLYPVRKISGLINRLVAC